jgi:hypothetical protein
MRLAQQLFVGADEVQTLVNGSSGQPPAGFSTQPPQFSAMTPNPRGAQ